MISAASADICTVVSVFPLELREDKPGLRPSGFTIPACKDPQTEVTTLMVARNRFSVYIDENRPSLIIPEPADVVAAAICRDYKVAVIYYEPDISEPGLFWVRGGYETPEEFLDDPTHANELKQARQKQNTWFRNLVAAGDDDWGKYRARKMISDIQRLAAKSLNLKRDWDIDMEIDAHFRPIPCKFCRAEVHPESIICQYCRGVLDLVRFRQEFIPADSPSSLIESAPPPINPPTPAPPAKGNTPKAQ